MWELSRCITITYKSITIYFLSCFWYNMFVCWKDKTYFFSRIKGVFGNQKYLYKKVKSERCLQWTCRYHQNNSWLFNIFDEYNRSNKNEEQALSNLMNKMCSYSNGIEKIVQFREKIIQGFNYLRESDMTGNRQRCFRIYKKNYRTPFYI